MILLPLPLSYWPQWPDTLSILNFALRTRLSSSPRFTFYSTFYSCFWTVDLTSLAVDFNASVKWHSGKFMNVSVTLWQSKSTKRTFDPSAFFLFWFHYFSLLPLPPPLCLTVEWAIFSLFTSTLNSVDCSVRVLNNWPAVSTVFLSLDLYFWRNHEASKPYSTVEWTQLYTYNCTTDTAVVAVETVQTAVTVLTDTESTFSYSLNWSQPVLQFSLSLLSLPFAQSHELFNSEPWRDDLSVLNKWSFHSPLVY